MNPDERQKEAHISRAHNNKKREIQKESIKVYPEMVFMR